MKKFSLAVTFLFVVVLFSSFVLAEDTYLARKVFTGSGSIQRYVDFDFIVPDSVKVYELKKSYYPYTQPAQWVLKTSGEVARKGFYRFIIDPIAGYTRFSIYGTLDFVEQMESWQALEVEPKEVGLFVKGKWEENNYFNLSEDDLAYSYHLVMSGYGMNTSLATIAKAEEFIFMHGALVGVIVGDSRGFLNKPVTGIALKNFLKKYVLRDDEIIILIYHE